MYLRELVEIGYTGSGIAKKLNERFNTVYSRNAVIGKLSRICVKLKRPANSSGNVGRYPSLRKSSGAKPRKPKPSKGLLAMLAEEVSMVETEKISVQPVHIFDAKDKHCRWPIGEPKDGMFCGNPVFERPGTHQWCASHCLIGLHVR